MALALSYNLPQEILRIIQKLESAGFEAFVVGGAVRDSIMKRTVTDFDIATNAHPEEIQKVFPDSVYENSFGTVRVKIRRNKQTYDAVEVTTYRVETGYSDNRRPDEVVFVKTLEEDLSRRDFTINAMALASKKVKAESKESNVAAIEIIDPFGGQEDIKSKRIRAVGIPDERFTEDALRLMRALRFAVQLDFNIEAQTLSAIKKHAVRIKNISPERIHDEFIKIIMARNAMQGIELLAQTGLLNYFLPELMEGYAVAQNKHHIYGVFEHSVRSLDYAAKKEYSLEVRLAALFHDIGKPRSKRGEGEAATFYNHEVIGAQMVKQLMRRLAFPKRVAEQVELLVRYHQFYYQAEEVTASSVRKLIKNVGKEHIDDLIRVREADRIGSGVPKAVPYKLRHLKYMIEQVSTDPISPKMLAVKGDDLMNRLGMTPGPHLGLIIKSLLAEVLDDPTLNTKEVLLSRARELQKLSPQELNNNLTRIEQAQREQEEEIKRKYYVQ